MAGILVLTIIAGALTALCTVVWWMMGEHWARRDRRARGPHATEPDPGETRRPAPRVIHRFAAEQPEQRGEKSPPEGIG
jgi:hypothetical protein